MTNTKASNYLDTTYVAETLTTALYYDKIRYKSAYILICAVLGHNHTLDMGRIGLQEKAVDIEGYREYLEMFGLF
jgi:hypothetical protein